MNIRIFFLVIMTATVGVSHAAGIPFVPSRPPVHATQPEPQTQVIPNASSSVSTPTQIIPPPLVSLPNTSGNSAFQRQNNEIDDQASTERRQPKSSQEIEAGKQVEHLRKMTEKLSSTSCGMTASDAKLPADVVVKKVSACLKNQHTQLLYQKEQIKNVVRAMDGLR